MDNNSRSERTRTAVIQSALTIIARDGPHRLTLDAIAKESGISKGGVMHQFPTKQAVIRALLDHQTQHFEGIYESFMAEQGAEHAHPQLAARINGAREAIAQPNSIALAIMAAMAQEPGLLTTQRDNDAGNLAKIRAETDDPDLATLRWLAALGMTLSHMIGLSPLSDADRDRLFARLLDERRWEGLANH